MNQETENTYGAALGHHVDGQTGSGSGAVLQTRSDFASVSEFTVLHTENVNGIRSHFFLRNEYFFRSVYDEVAAGIQRTLVQFSQITVGQTGQQAVLGSQHDWNFANKGLLMLRNCGGNIHR